MNDTTATETTNGEPVMVELDEAARQIAFSDENGNPIAAYDFAAFATVTGALALDLGADLILDAATVAGIQQWAHLDTTGN